MQGLWPCWVLITRTQLRTLANLSCLRSLGVRATDLLSGCTMFRLHNRTCLGCTKDMFIFSFFSPPRLPGGDGRGMERKRVQSRARVPLESTFTALFGIVSSLVKMVLYLCSLSPFSLSLSFFFPQKGWRNLQVDHGKLSVL